MMVKVYNKNVHPFKQEIKGKEYKIPAQSYIELDYDDASALVKSFSPIEVDFDNRPLPTSYKMLEIDKDDVIKYRELAQNKAKGGTYLCQACGYVASNRWELKGHAMSEHSHQFEDQDEALDSFEQEEQGEKDAKKRVRKKPA